LIGFDTIRANSLPAFIAGSLSWSEGPSPESIFADLAKNHIGKDLKLA
jgi:hypothetical protein